MVDGKDNKLLFKWLCSQTVCFNESAGSGKMNIFFLSLSSVISHFVFNFSMVEEDNDSFGFDALELDGKQNAIV